jgi:hypothetical protein
MENRYCGSCCGWDTYPDPSCTVCGGSGNDGTSTTYYRTSGGYWMPTKIAKRRVMELDVEEYRHDYIRKS